MEILALQKASQPVVNKPPSIIDLNKRKITESSTSKRRWSALNFDRTPIRSIDRLDRQEITVNPDAQHQESEVLLENGDAELAKSNNPFNAQDQSPNSAAQSEIVTNYKYLQQPLTCSQTVRLIIDSLLLIPLGVLMSLPLLVESVMALLGYFILNQGKMNTVISYLAFYVMMTTVIYNPFVGAANAVLTISCCQSFGQSDDKSVGKRYLTQTLFLLVLYTGIIYVPLIMISPSLMAMVGVDHDLVQNSKTIALKCLCVEVLEAFKYFITGYCNSQEIEKIFSVLSFVNLVPSVFICLLFGIHFEMGIDGWIIGRTIFSILDTASYLVVYYTQTSPSSRGLCSLRELWIELPEFINKTASLMLSFFFEILSLEIGTFMTSLTNSIPQIAAFGSATCIMGLSFHLSWGFMAVGRTRINYLIGRALFSAAKKMAAMILFAQSVWACIIGLGLYIFRAPVQGFFASNDQQQAAYLEKMLVFYCVFVQADVLYSTVMLLCRSTNQIAFSTAAYFVCCVCLNFGINYYLLIYQHADCLAFYVTLYACLFAALFVCCVRVFSLNWSKIQMLMDD